jgi:MiaB/RimO family radical SAM methylthiotransferase
VILNQVRAYVESGTAEIQITAQDVSAWGKDCGQSLAILLTRISEIPGRYRARVGMMNPATVKDNPDEIAEALSHDHIFRFVHLPVQSGSDPVLERMGRGYTIAEYEVIVAVFRRKIPDLTLATDMIVGFPGETDEDFSRSLELIERIRPNKINITRYSPRPLTGINSEKDFPDSVKKDRSRIMQARAEALYSQINPPCLNSIVPFIVTEKIRDGSVMARTPAYTGVVLNEDLPAGYEGRALLKKDRRYFFIGNLVE